MGHRVNGIAIVQSYANGKAFGRVDMTVATAGELFHPAIHPPQSICISSDECSSVEYEGRAVAADADVAQLVTVAQERARAVKGQPLGVQVVKQVERAYSTESALGNLFADLMLEARPHADVAITNGGGLRASFEVGDLRYGDLHAAMPFDNRFARVSLTGSQLRDVLASSLTGTHGILLVSGVRASAKCVAGKLLVQLADANGRAIPDGAPLAIVTSDFLAGGGDGIFAGLGLAEGAIVVEDAQPIRDAMADVLKKRGGRLAGDDPTLFDPARPRLSYPGKRPVSCPAR